MKEEQPWLIFELTSEFRAAVKLDHVVEIVPAVTLPPLPNAGPFIEGVADIRGRVMPVLNMRRVFQLEDRPMIYSDHLIIVRTSQQQLCILRVDRTIELVDLNPDAESLSADNLVRVPYIDGVAKHNGRLILLHNPLSLISVLSNQSERSGILAAAGRGVN